jgi:glutamine amidotransferase-like uncharacterized protein
MPHNIFVYADVMTATGSLMPSLQQTFNAQDYKIHRITAQDILGGVLRTPQSGIFILPGIVGEVSPYTAQLPLLALQEISDFVGRNNNVMLTLCAGSYFIARQTIYVPDHGAPKGRHSLAPMFNGVARGPVPGYGRASSNNCQFDDVIAVPVNFKTADGSWDSAKICYGNGPALYPDDTNHPDIEVLARFADSPGEPVALLRQSFGAGALYMSCVIPDIAYQHIEAERGHESARKLMNELKDHETGRQKLWSTLTNRMKQDLK